MFPERFPHHGCLQKWPGCWQNEGGAWAQPWLHGWGHAHARSRSRLAFLFLATLPFSCALGTKHGKGSANPNHQGSGLQQGSGSNSPEAGSIGLLQVICVLQRMAFSEFIIWFLWNLLAQAAQGHFKTKILNKKPAESVYIPRLPILQSW